MSDNPDLDAAPLAAAERIHGDPDAVTATDERLLAQALLDIAGQAMPVRYNDPRAQLARAVLAANLIRAQRVYWDDTCGDCVEGRCHWGGDASRASIEAARAGVEYEDPRFGRCGCARHTTSVTARAYEGETFEQTVWAWQAAKDAGTVTVYEDDDTDTIIWISNPTRLT